MKKILALLLFLCFAFTGCNQTTDSKSENITTATPAAKSTESVTTTTPTIPPSSTTNTNSKIVKTTDAPKTTSTTTTSTTSKIDATPTTTKPSSPPATPSNDDVIIDLFNIVKTTVAQKTTPTTTTTTSKIDAKPTATKPSTPSNDDIIKNLFNKKQSDVQVRGNGVVTKILPDDNDGTRHQRFILKLNSGQTLLIAHNIDIASRLEGLAVGEKIEFYGEYYYNNEGGGVHWTHHDPNGRHVSGYLKRNGKIPQTTTTKTTTTTTPNTNKSNSGNRNYIGNINSHILHVPTCDSLPYERNRIYFGTIQEALNKGYHKHYECMGN
ncbi:MAG: DUF3465 domain-containing protein [Planctomycetaceae bacterium]|jgi:hypothetical protein|nr:DUF3465 domain-containing protein [Planctomycetaceae bacterium]